MNNEQIDRDSCKIRDLREGMENMNEEIENLNKENNRLRETLEKDSDINKIRKLKAIMEKERDEVHHTINKRIRKDYEDRVRKVNKQLEQLSERELECEKKHNDLDKMKKEFEKEINEKNKKIKEDLEKTDR